MKTMYWLLTALLLAVATNLHAQTKSYRVNRVPDGGNPGGLLTTDDHIVTGWTAITSGSQSSNSWSSSQTLPFGFELFGETVSSYQVSLNGLLTFTSVSGSSTIVPQNSALPEVTLPNKTIACFWDEFTASPPIGSNDKVYTKVVGSAPNRQVWVKWFSYEIGNPAATACYFACVLEEGTNKVYLVDMNKHNGNVTATIGVQYDSQLATAYGTNQNVFGTGGTGLSDNDYYVFTPEDILSPSPTLAYDASLTLDGGNPGGLNTDYDYSTTGWTAISSGTQYNNSWTSVQSLPFPFSFYGEDVVQFKASQNGLLTFDVTAGTPPSANGLLPSTTLPDATIACFWDAFTSSAPTPSSAKLYTKVVGTAPYRQMWIKWHGMELGSPATPYAYFACVLEESTNAIHLVDMNYSSSANIVSATVGVQANASVGMTYGVDQVAFGLGSYTTSDNDVYSFVPQFGNHNTPTNTYLTNQVLDNGNPGGLNTDADYSTTGWSAISNGSQANNGWTGAQALPFDFEFYGVDVSQFKVSQNGVVTFDVTSNTLPAGNQTLPSNGLPDQSIACYWDAFTSAPPTGSNDKIYTKVFGTAPNRQLWIKWHSFEMGSPSSSYNYWACALEEGSNKIYLVDMNYHNATNVTATGGLQWDDNIGQQFGLNDLAFGIGGSGNGDNDVLEFTPNLQINLGTPYNDAELANLTPKSFYPESVNLNDGCLQFQKDVTILAKFNLGEDYDYGKNAFASNVTFSVRGYDQLVGGNLLFEELVQPLDLSEVQPEAWFKLTLADADANAFKRVDVTINGYTPHAMVKDDVVLDIVIDENVRVNVNTPPYDVQSLVSVNAPNGNTNPVNFSWTTACEGVTNYEIQVVRTFNQASVSQYDETIVHTTTDWSGALSIITESADLQQALTIVEGTGAYLWRVRPIGNYYPGGIANPKNLGVWSDAPVNGKSITLEDGMMPGPYGFFYHQFDEDKNMIYSRVMTEGGRIAEGLTYANGLLFPGQVQGKQSSTPDTLLMGQPLYDYSGRGAGSTLSAPVDQTGFGYLDKLVTSDANGTILYGPEQYDTDLNLNNPAPVLGGVIKRYYSDDNPDLTIPDAEGYAFSRTSFQNDGTGRPKEQGAPGATLSLGNDHTTTISYERATEAELIRVFGDEAPRADMVYRMVTKDPNDVVSYAYVDNNGKTLATALVDNGFNNTLDHLDSRANGGVPIVENIVVGNTGAAVQHITKQFFIATNNVQFDYDLTPPQYALDCEYQFCSTCDYAVRVEIRDMDANVVVHSFDTLLNPQTCGQNAEDLTFSFQYDFPEGRFKVSRILETEQTLIGDNHSVKTQKMLEAEQNLEQHLYDQVNGTNGDDLIGFLENDNLEAFYTALGVDYETAEDGDEVNLQVGCADLTFPVKKCDTITCENLDMDFEQLLYDAYPQVGDEANEFFFTNGQPTFPPQREINFQIWFQNANGTTLRRIYVDSKHGEVDLLPEDYAKSIHPLDQIMDFGDIQSDIDGETARHHYTASYNHISNTFNLQTEIGAFADLTGEIVVVVDDPNNISFLDGGFIDLQNATYANGKGAFNQLISNMVADGYPCDQLQGCWAGLVNAWGSMVDYEMVIDEGQILNPVLVNNPVDIELDINHNFDLLGTFLQCTGYMLEGISDCPYGDCDGQPGEEGFLDHAHRFINYTPGQSPQCETEIEDADGYTFADWQQTPSVWPQGDSVWFKFRQCVISLGNYENNAFFPTVDEELEPMDFPEECNNGGGMDLVCAEHFQDIAQDECMDLCEERYTSFILALISFYIEQGYTVQPNPDEPGNYQLAYTDLECQAALMIESCDQLCTLTIVYDQNNDIVGLGTPAEIFAIQQMYTHLPEFEMAGQGNSCGNEFTLTETSVEKSNIAILHLKETLSDALLMAGANGTCWDFLADVAYHYDAIDILGNSSYSIESCNPGITVIPQATRQFYTVTASNDDGLVEDFVADLNDALEDGENTSVSVPVGMPFMNGACTTVGAFNLSTVSFSFNVGTVTVTFNIIDANNNVLSCIQTFPTTDPDYDFVKQANQVLAFVSTNTTINTCLTFCDATGCSLNFRQTTTCGNINQAFVDLLNDHANLGGTIEAEEFPVGLTLLDAQQNPVKASTLYPNGLTIGTLGFNSPFIVQCHSGAGDDFDIVPNGTFILDEDQSTIYYYRTGPDAEAITCLTPGCNNGSQEVLISAFSVQVTCAPSSCDPICFQWVAPDFGEPDIFEPTECVSYAAKDLLISLYAQVDEAIANQIGLLEAQWQATCPYPTESFTMGYSEGIHHYTLFYHDRAGNVVRTVPPAGVDFSGADRNSHNAHTMMTEYEYNSLGELVSEHTPDGDTSRTWYDELGRVRFGQNAQQKLDGTFTYVKYDELGRSTSGGLADLPMGQTNAVLADEVNNADYPNGGQYNLRELMETVLDVPMAEADEVYGEQRFLRNRVSYSYVDWDGDLSTTDDYYRDVYSYDAHGNIEWLRQDIPGLGSMRMAYEYDLISGNVLMTKYNEGQEDQFFHRYSYDEDNRIILAETSTDGVMWDRDARYKFYAHGPLQRAVIGEDKVQGIDHVHTIHGWLKAINHPELGTANDPGKDGVNGNVARDAFGMTLGYFAGDFKRTNSAFASNGAENAAHRNATTKTNGATRNLYNGNIATWASNVADLSSNAIGVTGQQFSYDEINRITESNFSTYNGTWNSSADYYSSYAYDGNGNLTSLNRTGNNGQAMDQFTYHYENGNNRLNHVSDVINAAAYTEDLDNQSNNNYTYDASGRLIADAGEGILSIVWNASDRVERIVKDDGNGGQEVISFQYGPLGHRQVKTVTYNDDSRTNTLYVRDASGVILATYKREDSAPTGGKYNSTYHLLEQPIYGMDRVGQRQGSQIWQKNDIVENTVEDLPYGNSIANYIVAEASTLVVPYGDKAFGYGGQDDLPDPDEDLYGDIRLGSFEFPGIGNGSAGDPVHEYTGDAPVNLAVAEDECGNHQITFFVSNEYQGQAQSVVLDATGTLMPGSQGIYADAYGQSAIVARPGSPGVQYLFTVDNGELYAHCIDLNAEGNGSKDNPLGEVVGKNQHVGSIGANALGMAVQENRNAGEATLFVKRHVPNSNITSIDAYAINQSGIQVEASVYTFNYEQSSAIQDLQVSPRGQYVATATNHANSGGHGVRILNQEVDGTLSDHQNHLAWTSNREVSSLDFSPAQQNGDALYVYFIVNQTNGSTHELWRYPVAGGSAELVPGISFSNTTAALRRGKDNNLYIAEKNRGSLYRIENPNGALNGINVVNVSVGPGGLFQRRLSGGLPLQNQKQGQSLFCESAPVVCTRVLGQKQYQLSDHLGNVRAVVSDHKQSVAAVNVAPHDFRPEVLTYSNYYPFGMEMPGRNASSDLYRYGFNGMEKDDEVKGGGNSYTTQFRQYDPRVGRWLSIDPLASKFPDVSPYAAFANSPLIHTDPNGLRPWRLTQDKTSGENILVPTEKAFDKDGNVKQDKLRRYLQRTGVKYSQSEFDFWVTTAEVQYANSGYKLKDVKSGNNGVMLESWTGQFDNLVGKLLVKQAMLDPTWGYIKRCPGGVCKRTCSACVANRVKRAVKEVYGEDSDEYNLIKSRVAYWQFQNAYATGQKDVTDVLSDGESGVSMGLTQGMIDHGIAGPIELTGLGTIVEKADMWTDLKPGAVLGLARHTAIFLRYTRVEGKLAMEFWDDENKIRTYVKGESTYMFPKVGGNFN